MQEMGSRRGFSRRDLGRVRVVAVHADQTLHLTRTAVPKTGSAAMCARFPITIGRAVAAPAKAGTGIKLNFVSIAGLEQFQVVLVMAVETVVVAVVAAMGHYNIGVFLRDDQVEVGVEPESRGLALLMTGVAVEI